MAYVAESYLERQNGSVQDTQSNAAQPLGAWVSRPRLMHYEIYTLTPPQSSNIESALIYAYFMSGVIKKHFLTLTIYFFSSFMLNSAKLFVLLRSETDSKMDIKDFI